MAPERSGSNSMSGKTIVVTGSSRGIGSATARALAAKGADVIVHGRTKSESLEKIRASLDRAGVDSIAIDCDFSKPEGLAAFVESCWNWKGQIDGWVHAAGVDVLTTDLRQADWHQRMEALWQVDVSAASILLKETGRRMRQHLSGIGSVVTIGWDQAWHGMDGEAGLVFGTTKGAVMAMTLSLANMYSPRVRFNCVAPGWVKTAWGETAGKSWQDRATSESLLNEWATPDDIAQVAAFLLGEESRFLNGQIIPVNGGFRHGRPDLTQDKNQ